MRRAAVGGTEISYRPRSPTKPHLPNGLAGRAVTIPAGRTIDPPFDVTSAEQHQPAKSADSFLVRHDFLLRRLHSLSGLIPVGAYMVVHLLTNASVLESAAKFQDNVYTIHSLGRALPVVEWVFIFIPLLFHALFGMVIIASGSA